MCGEMSAAAKRGAKRESPALRNHAVTWASAIDAADAVAVGVCGRHPHTHTHKRAGAATRTRTEKGGKEEEEEGRGRQRGKLTTSDFAVSVGREMGEAVGGCGMRRGWGASTPDTKRNGWSGPGARGDNAGGGDAEMRRARGRKGDDDGAWRKRVYVVCVDIYTAKMTPFVTLLSRLSWLLLVGCVWCSLQCMAVVAMLLKRHGHF